ncbi:MAG: hypothetical protein QS2022_0060 [Candidatus Phytoplasma asteris]|uniref:Uncharacterized protein n=1 Tax='Chrysanthemum coronarium' phytoplasma TaxID=1520703 RepID=A0ABQ0J1V9_9MOLU|nr:hypothetical protein ['Chrysanthemum coronarium' phytoplasma]TKA88209.1 MAG: hypothetical protein PLY_0060 [Periwinkle leaf yellowing phytoplasma]WEX19304.1 MAG: hypothetical protein QS2022_0060 [Candidatus Phytoplasma asteris]GAK73585.1 uncharacterized protein OYV_00640 ['Chrysanthemum coronarium' phytoplasma]
MKKISDLEKYLEKEQLKNLDFSRDELLKSGLFSKEQLKDYDEERK